MASNFEIGQKVKWQIGIFQCKGLYLQSFNDELSTVQCYEKNDKRHITKLEVVTELLQLDQDDE